MRTRNSNGWREQASTAKRGSTPHTVPVERNPIVVRADSYQVIRIWLSEKKISQYFHFEYYCNLTPVPCVQFGIPGYLFSCGVLCPLYTHSNSAYSSVAPLASSTALVCKKTQLLLLAIRSLVVEDQTEEILVEKKDAPSNPYLLQAVKTRKAAPNSLLPKPQNHHDVYRPQVHVS